MLLACDWEPVITGLATFIVFVGIGLAIFFVGRS